MKASIDSIETFGLVDGPGIRVVVFFNGCKLRCKYCHNPEMWKVGKENYTVDELVNKIIRYKPYFKQNGGVTFSGGEPLLHSNFIIEVSKILKKENIHIAIDTSGVGLGKYEEVLENIDLILLDIKHTDKDIYEQITGASMQEVERFIETVNRLDKKVWIRQVIIPGIMDNEEYINNLVTYLQHIKHVERVDFLPFHRLGREKYIKLGITYPYENKNEMDQEECHKLYQLFLEKQKRVN